MENIASLVNAIVAVPLLGMLLPRFPAKAAAAGSATF